MNESQASWRTFAYRVCIVVFVLGMIASTTAIWANVRLQDGDAWAETVGPLADDPAVQAFVVEQAALMIDQQIAADENAGLLQSVGRNQLSGLVRATLNEFVATPTFKSWWTEANRSAHGLIMRTLDEEQGLVLQTQGENLVLDLTPAVDWVNNQITTVLPNSGYLIAIPPERAVIVLYASETLDTVARIIDAVDTLAFVLPLITIVALAATLILAVDRHVALIRVALSLVAGTTFLLVLVNIGRWIVISRQPTSHQDVLDAIVKITLSDLLSALRVTAIVALLVAGVIILMQSQRAQDSRVMAFIHKNRKPIVATAIGITLASILTSNYPPIWISVMAPVVIIYCVMLLLRWRNEHAGEHTAT